MSEGFYQTLDLPEAPSDRPYTAINMVATIDGKILTGERDEPVQDLGSKIDHASMRNIQSHFQAVMIGASTLRATPKLRYPSHLKRIVVSESGNLDFTHRFFTEGEVFAATEKDLPIPTFPLDFKACFQKLRAMGVESLLIEGGSNLNASLLELDLIDELFLTLAPKIKLGKDVPTYADGIPLPREKVQDYDLIELNRYESEIFLRYRRNK